MMHIMITKLNDYWYFILAYRTRYSRSSFIQTTWEMQGVWSEGVASVSWTNSSNKANESRTMFKVLKYLLIIISISDCVFFKIRILNKVKNLGMFSRKNSFLFHIAQCIETLVDVSLAANYYYLLPLYYPEF